VDAGIQGFRDIHKSTYIGSQRWTLRLRKRTSLTEAIYSAGIGGVTYNRICAISVLQQASDDVRCVQK
jgi:hypothetical protein